jgi:hypothetical protein
MIIPTIDMAMALPTAPCQLGIVRALDERRRKYIRLRIRS